MLKDESSNLPALWKEEHTFSKEAKIFSFLSTSARDATH
jgi:hypothetical protein